MAVPCPKCGKSITVSDKKTGTAKDYVNRLEWDCAIAAADQEIDALRNSGSQKSSEDNANAANQASETQEIDAQKDSDDQKSSEDNANAANQASETREIDTQKDSSDQKSSEDNANAANQTSNKKQTTGTPQQQLAEAYLYRGIACCLKANKEGAYDEAIKDLSRAITLCDSIRAHTESAPPKSAPPESAPQNSPEVLVADQARYYLGYAYYLNADYERAIAYCDNCDNCHNCDKPEKSELLGKIYMAMGRYKEAADSFANALKVYFAAKQHPGPHLLHEYQEARKRMNSV